MAKTEDKLTLHIASTRDDVNADAFLEVFAGTLKALKEINKDTSDHGVENIVWRIVAVGLNSPIFATLKGESTSSSNGDSGGETIATLMSGLRHLEKKNTCPPGFGEASLRSVAQLTASFARGVTRIEFVTERQRAQATKRISSNAQFALKKIELKMAKRAGKYVEDGTIEGQLKELSVLTGSKDKILIVDDLTGNETICYFRGKELEDTARGAWKHRVSVTGEITTDRASGKPQRMDVKAISILRSRSELPQISDLSGIDITGGIESSEYVRGLRDAE